MGSGWKTIDDFYQQTPEADLTDSERYVSYSLNDLYPEWQEQAHCAGVGVNYYFGDEDEQPTMSIKQVRRASKLCDVCPVFEECLRWSITNREYYGVWAGTSGRTRKILFRMLDAGETTVDEIVEVVLDGRIDEYRSRGSADARRRDHRRDDEGGEGVVLEALG